MMEQVVLIDHILKQCQLQKWYGSDNRNTARYTKHGERYTVFYLPTGKEIVTDNDPDDHPCKTSFAYPPATEEQLQATERELGFPLPSFLRMLYTKVANGGFGPAFGLHGVLDGFDDAGNIVDGYNYHRNYSKMFDLEEYTSSLKSHGAFDVPEPAWPRYMLYLCDWGRAITSCIDAVSGQVYAYGPSETTDFVFTFRQEAPSLEAWFASWLEGSLPERGQTPYPPPHLLFESDNYEIS